LRFVSTRAKSPFHAVVGVIEQCGFKVHLNWVSSGSDHQSFDTLITQKPLVDWGKNNPLVV
jgi:hypothetical protein